MKFSIAAFLLLASGIPSGTQPFHRVLHFLATHKELIAADAIVVASWSADAASTVNAEHNCPTCVESNVFLGPHPSAHALWFTGTATASGQIVLNHLLWRRAPLPLYRHMVWIPAVAIAVTEANNVLGNVQAAQQK